MTSLSKSHQSIIDKILPLYQEACKNNCLLSPVSEALSQEDYQIVIDWYESSIWDQGLPDDLVKSYQALHKDYQKKYADNQRNIIVVIPVADRPNLLRQCITSIHQQCEKYHYGGTKNNMYHRVRVLIADDSRNEDNIVFNKALCDEFLEKGIDVEYFGLDQQKSLLAACDSDIDYLVDNRETAVCAHKGASVTRNLVYLKLKKQLINDETLVYFIDSDQEFKVSYDGAENLHAYYEPNYFYHLNRVFENPSIKIVTGKVVGDPPVSPSVMTGKMLDDILAFISDCEISSEGSVCKFHSQDKANVEDAAYHDMSDMFGFESKKQPYRYNCDLMSQHTINHAFIAFSAKLEGFFHGAHPTRKSWYEYQAVMNSIKPARTVYTGNYIIRGCMLDHYIPFASLKLRMAGPVLGRLLKASFDESFVSVNLPMLHNRTFSNDELSEYRAGVENQQSLISLSNESERQYFGDVMLFTVERLIELGYPRKLPDRSIIIAELENIDNELYQKFEQRRASIIEKADQLKAKLNNDNAWWNSKPEMLRSVNNFNRFLDNVYLNFSNEAVIVGKLSNDEFRTHMLEKLLSALLNYPADMANWSRIYKRV